MPSTRRMKKNVRGLRSLRHRPNTHTYDRKAGRRRLRLLKEFRRLKALESKPAQIKAEKS
jgi:hypothetical protein